MIALPVEFVDVLESTELVDLKDNPWSDLPPSLVSSQHTPLSNHLLPLHSAQSTSTSSALVSTTATVNSDTTGAAPSTLFGYDTSKVLEFLYNVRVFFYIAESIWTPQLTLRDFTAEIISLLNKGADATLDMSVTINQSKADGFNNLNKKGKSLWRDELRPYVEHLYFKVNDVWCVC